MDIAAMSIGMSTSTLVQGAQIAMLRKTMDLQENTANALIQSMQELPSFGHQLDVRA